MTSSTDFRPLQLPTLAGRDDAAAVAPGALPTPELRDGGWTRYGGDRVLGDPVTEQVLGSLSDRALEAARARGYAAGWAEGRQAASETARKETAEREQANLAEQLRRDHEHRQAVNALLQAAQQLQHATADVATALEQRALEVAGDLTEALVGHELRTAPEPAADMARRILRVLPDGVRATVRVHPDLAHDLAGHLADLNVAVVADPALPRADAIAETDSQVIDAGVTTALARVREALA